MIRRISLRTVEKSRLESSVPCKEMNIKTVAVYSTADKEALHVQLGGLCRMVGGPRANDSYLNMKKVSKRSLYDSL